LWHPLAEAVGNVPWLVESLKSQGKTAPPALPGYEGREAVLGDLFNTAFDLMNAWRSQDASGVNKHVAHLAGLLPQVNAAQYPSEARLKVEVVYNRLAKLTIPGAAFYFAAFVCFLMAARSGVAGLRLWGLRLFTVGLLVHTLGIAVRWWLVASQHGNWFDGIPIKNQFESVLMSAWFGALVGYILEMRRSRGVFGAAASFVGWMSLVAIFSVPFVVGRDIGGEIGQVSGVLMSYWLYIHVTMVTASYALIGMGFLLSVWWLIRYYAAREAEPERERQFAPAIEAEPAGGAVALGFGGTLARMLFVPAHTTGVPPMGRSAAGHGRDARATPFLATLDACNLIVLQLAFWILGAGIICGAIWADQSWGRPWGWDPKETFALVTWIVYLIVVHVRVATEDKAWWTAVLSIVGFVVMLFNWIGVNFFLVGLHSYA
jgi:cytochrome c-type biogenesis protein CcsB